MQGFLRRLPGCRSPGALALGLGLVLALAGSRPLAAQPAAGPPVDKVYIVQLREPPAIPALSAAGTRSRITARRKFDARSEAVRSYAAGLVESHDRVLATVGATDAKVYSYRLAFNGFAARLTPDQAAKLAAQPGVAGIWEDSVRHLQTNASASYLGLTDTAAGLRNSLGLKGEDVVIGVIDSGIAAGHPSFTDKAEKKKPHVCRTDWGKSSLLGAWLCTRYKKPRYTMAYTPPTDWRGACETGPGFTTADCNNKLIGARFYVDGFNELYVRDENDPLSPHDADGHGTHIASIAAGNPVKAALGGTVVASITGMAPRARIAVYKACWLQPGATRGTCAMSDLQRAIEDAVADGVDILNYAVGTTQGGPTDPDSLALLAASDAGVLAVVAAGNGGPDPSTIESPGSAPWVLTVAASSRAGQRFDEVVRGIEPATSVGDFASKEAAFTPSLKATGAIEDLLILAQDGTPPTSDGCESLTNGAAIRGHIVLFLRVDPKADPNTCSFQEKIASAEAAGARAAIIYNDAGAPIIMTGERDSVGIPAVMIGRGDGNFLVTRLAAGDAVKVRLEKGRIATRSDAGNVIYTESARGPNPITFDILKPDVTAPGVDILGAQTRDVANGVRGERYQYLSGTSMAVPHVAGVAALLKQAHPDWSPAAIRSALVTTARQDLHKPDGAAVADPFDFGGGHIVPNRAIAPGLVYDAGRDDYDAFACGAGIPRVSDEACAALADAGFPTSIEELNLPSLSLGSIVGERTVRRRVTNVGPAGSWQAQIAAPAGVGMAVAPAVLSLSAGETGEFAVTFTNLGDAKLLATWGFGALTWVNGPQQVRSPVAVRTVALAAPAAVAGADATGGTEFDVEFGYDGAYAATAAGLVAPVTSMGLVLDDPLGVYDIIEDDTALPDHIRRFRVTVPTGALYLRVALTGMDADSHDDIDLVIFCPAPSCPGGRTLLAGNGATADEVIDILTPTAGEYVIDVYGFETDDVVGGPGANFALRTWTVPAAPVEGNLVVSAPASATVGGTGTVGITWQDLAPGEVYLGLITHDDGTRELGQTLLEVVVE